MLMDFYEEGFLPRDAYVTKDSASLFRTGQYGFHLSGNWNVSNYQDLDFEWTVVPMPQNSNRATILGGKSLAAFKDSGLEEEAQDFIAWMAEAEQHDAYTGGVPYLTPRLGAEVDYGDFTAEYNVFLDEIANTDNMYVQDWLNQVMIPGMYPIINQFVEDAANGTVGTAEELLAQLEEDLQAAVE
jgi:alpha-1,4-digalacturonate transport system substrate-binding protein